MDLNLKIAELNSNVERIEQLIEDINESLESKIKKINYLKKQIELNVNKIDEIIEDYNADN